jgi:hypothetical protein
MSHHKSHHSISKPGKDGKNGRHGCRGKRGHQGEPGLQGTPGKNAPFTILQTQYALVREAGPIAGGSNVLVVTLPITMTSVANGGTGVLEILATFSFTAIQGSSEVRWSLSIDGGPLVLASSSNAPAISTSASGSMVFSTKSAPLTPGPHTIELFAAPTSPIVLVANQNHAAIFAQETTN